MVVGFPGDPSCPSWGDSLTTRLDWKGTGERSPRCTIEKDVGSRAIGLSRELGWEHLTILPPLKGLVNFCFEVAHLRKNCTFIDRGCSSDVTGGMMAGPAGAAAALPACPSGPPLDPLQTPSRPPSVFIRRRLSDSTGSFSSPDPEPVVPTRAQCTSG
eukprot:1194913-Prorocentrum_minimum.AAC.4